MSVVDAVVGLAGESALLVRMEVEAGATEEQTGKGLVVGVAPVAAPVGAPLVLSQAVRVALEGGRSAEGLVRRSVSLVAVAAGVSLAVVALAVI